jgi:PPOX class probable F420-dependent enzyme
MSTLLLRASDNRLLHAARTATLATIDDHGRPRLVPCCFAFDAGDAGTPPKIWTPIDDKRKRSPDPHWLGRVADLLARPAVSLLVDHWSEDWTRLAWLRLHGRARLLEPAAPHDAGRRQAAIEALRVRYPQYREHDLEVRPIIEIEMNEAIRWAASAGPGEAGSGD